MGSAQMEERMDSGRFPRVAMGYKRIRVEGTEDREHLGSSL